MKKSNKSWIRQLSESYVRHTLNEQSDNHQKIKDFLMGTLAKQYPHKTNPKNFHRPDAEASAAHIAAILDQTGPHTSAESAIAAIRPHAIDGNYGLEERIYERRPEEHMGGDITEHPYYEELVAENEEDYADSLTGDLEHHLSSGGGSEDNRIPRSM